MFIYYHLYVILATVGDRIFDPFRNRRKPRRRVFGRVSHFDVATKRRELVQGGEAEDILLKSKLQSITQKQNYEGGICTCLLQL
mgnify:CR=1 FL=1